ncbi:acyltransferase [Methylophilaceae bacterium]|nr:acyltransferase [Methylophilaceae bacterium]
MKKTHISKNYTNSYRPEIDGLRTIAVLSVLFYHAQIQIFGINFFKGGYVGVDIFFVISGYLISRILFAELFDKGKICFLRFYERRARRILPILFTVFFISFPIAYKYLLPNQLTEFSQSILSATFFGSNIFFYLTNTLYGAENSLLQPFLHTWSLGVEEQFYILIPFIILFSFKFAQKYILLIIFSLIIISLQYSNWESTRNIQYNFFMLPSRIWELSVGCLLAYYELMYGRTTNKLLIHIMPFIGLCLIMYSIIFFSNETPHPSFTTLIPIIGTSLIIFYSMNKIDYVGKILSFKLTVGIGLISYSIYLWHYPIFAFSRINSHDLLQNYEKIFLIIITIFLSIISYYLIEKPFRKKNYLKTKTFVKIMTFSAVIVITITTFYSFYKPPEIKKMEDLIYERLEYRNEICGLDNKICKNKKNILIVGDSMVIDALNILLVNQPINYDLSTLGGCPPIEDKKIGKGHPDRERCISLNERRLATNLKKYDGIVIINRYGWFTPKDIEYYLKFLRKSQFKNVLMFGDGLSIDKNYTELHEKKEFEYILKNIDYGKPDKEFLKLSKKYNFQFISIKDALIPMIDEKNIKKQNHPIIIDKHHLSLESAKIISKKNEQKIDRFLENTGLEKK